MKSAAAVEGALGRRRPVKRRGRSPSPPRARGAGRAQQPRAGHRRCFDYRATRHCPRRVSRREGGETRATDETATQGDRECQDNRARI